MNTEAVMDGVLAVAAVEEPRRVQLGEIERVATELETSNECLQVAWVLDRDEKVGSCQPDSHEMKRSKS